MNTPELIKEVALRLGIPEKQARQVIFDFSRDIQSIVSAKTTGGFIIPHIGFFFINVDSSILHLQVLIVTIEKLAAKKKDILAAGYPKFRMIFTKKVDDFYSTFTLILENQAIRNENYKRGAGKKVEVDMDILKQLMVRMDNVINELPTTLSRNKYTEIQKICMRRLQKQGILQSPLDKDCKVQPMRVRTKS